MSETTTTPKADKYTVKKASKFARLELTPGIEQQIADNMANNCLELHSLTNQLKEVERQMDTLKAQRKELQQEIDEMNGRMAAYGGWNEVGYIEMEFAAKRYSNLDTFYFETSKQRSHGILIEEGQRLVFSHTRAGQSEPEWVEEAQEAANLFTKPAQEEPQKEPSEEGEGFPHNLDNVKPLRLGSGEAHEDDVVVDADYEDVTEGQEEGGTQGEEEAPETVPVPMRMVYRDFIHENLLKRIMADPFNWKPTKQKNKEWAVGHLIMDELFWKVFYKVLELDGGEYPDPGDLATDTERYGEQVENLANAAMVAIS